MSELKFIQVGELAKGISENLLPDSNALACRSLSLSFDDGTTAIIRFDSENTLSWEVVEGSGKRAVHQETYRATCLRDHIFFVDYISRVRGVVSISLIIDLKANVATRVIGTLPSEAETKKDILSRANEGMDLSVVSADFSRATVDRPFIPEDAFHSPTTEMVGKRFMYVYSRSESYEHIYLNENLYTWHCLSGAEKGLADTDRCHYRKIDDALYLFVWREKIIPTLGVVLLDWEQMKTTGKLFGYESSDFSKLTNTPLGAYATMLNETIYM